jgi:toxin ParE1/3/4
MKPVILHSIAEAELSDAISYYENQSDELSTAFQRDFEALLKRIIDNPLLYAIETSQGLRYALFERFPYRIVYMNLPDKIWVSAITHHKRRPRSWLNRLPE